MIGVFDSGLGGLTVLRELVSRFRHADFVYLADHANVPYGNRASDEIVELTRAATEDLFNRGAKLGGFAHDTGEGGISPYHVEHGGDLIWEIGSGYFGCRDAEGRFDEERFVANASSDHVRMIHVKLS